MERLGGLDAVFLAIEGPVSPMNIGSVGVFDGPVPSLESVREFVTAKILLVPRCRQRVRECWRGVARPVSELGWLDDGRVTVTFYGESQKIIDVTTGAVENVPVAQVPQVAPDRQPVTVSQDGRRLTSINDGGRVQIIVEQNGTTRVLLDVKGGSTYEIGTPQWSPDETFVLTTDSAARPLVTTLGDTPQTRVLATQLGSGFAVTSVEF